MERLLKATELFQAVLTEINLVSSNKNYNVSR